MNAPDSNPSPLKAALGYAARGWYIFPSEIVGKIKKSRKSAKHSNGRNWGMTNDPEEIMADYRRWPEAGIGIPTGKVNGIFVVEADTKEGHDVDGIKALRELEALHGKLPPTLMAESPSGSLHHFFKHPGDKVWSSTSSLGKGVDVKGDGGMVIAPPTMRIDGQYKWLNDLPMADPPQWLLEKVSRPRVRDCKQWAGGEARDAPQGMTAAAMKIIPNDGDWTACFENYSDWTGYNNILMALFDATEGSEDGYQIALEWCKKNVEKFEVRETVHEAWYERIAGCPPNQLHVGTIFALANFYQPGFTAEWNRQHEGDGTLVVVRVSDVAAKKINWLWPKRIACGKLTMIAGMPDVNKSTLMLHLAASTSIGGPLPAGEGTAQLGSVIILSAEDDIADTIRPRLEVCGADLDLIHVITATRGPSNTERTFDLTADIDKLKKLITRIGDVKLIIIDPVSAYMGKPGKLDSYRISDVRGTLAPLSRMAADTGVAVVGIDHLNKSGGNQALLRIIGSIAFSAAPRSIYLIVRDEEQDDRRLFLPAKNNIAKIRTGLAFRIKEKMAPPPVSENYPVIEWETGAVTMTADEALGQKHDGRRSEVVEKAKTMLAEMLAERPRLQTDVEAAAGNRSIGPNSLKTAKKAMDIISTRTGGKEGQWWWSLPGREKPF